MTCHYSHYKHQRTRRRNWPESRKEKHKHKSQSSRLERGVKRGGECRYDQRSRDVSASVSNIDAERGGATQNNNKRDIKAKKSKFQT